MQVTERVNRDIVICDITGDIDINSSPQIRSEFDKLIAKKIMKIIINLQGVSYVDSSGLATLVEMLKRTKGYSGKLLLSNLSDKVKSLFEITKLERLFDIYDDEEDATAKFV